MHDMPGMGDSINTRTISAFPLSIGTSLAFESLFPPRLDPYDPERKIPEKVDISHYSQIYINVSTMFRNIVGAISKNALNKTSPLEFKETIEFEIDVINNLLLTEGSGICVPVYYITEHDKLEKKLASKAISFRKNNTESQKYYASVLDETLNILYKYSDSYVKTDEEIRPKNNARSLIITHIAYDLLSYKNFRTLDLLESHTGKLKHKHNWNSKYANLGLNDLSLLPFNRKLLLLFGDKVMIHPSDYKLRKTIYDIAVSRHWTPVTTEAKMMQDFEIVIKEPYVLNYIKSL